MKGIRVIFLCVFLISLEVLKSLGESILCLQDTFRVKKLTQNNCSEKTVNETLCAGYNIKQYITHVSENIRRGIELSEHLTVPFTKSNVIVMKKSIIQRVTFSDMKVTGHYNFQLLSIYAIDPYVVTLTIISPYITFYCKKEEQGCIIDQKYKYVLNKTNEIRNIHSRLRIKLFVPQTNTTVPQNLTMKMKISTVLSSLQDRTASEVVTTDSNDYYVIALTIRQAIEDYFRRIVNELYRIQPDE